MCVLHSQSGNCKKPLPSEMEQMYTKYQAWQRKFADNIIDMSGKLGDNASVVKKSGVTDEPFVELKKIIGRITHTSPLWNSDFKLITPILNSGMIKKLIQRK